MKLSARQIQRLQKLRRESEHGSLSYDQFKSAISAPFTSQTLLNAMRGNEVNPSTYHFLIGVLQRHAPETAVEPDGKALASGAGGQAEVAEPSEESDGPSEGEKTRRGSR